MQLQLPCPHTPDRRPLTQGRLPPPMPGSAREERRLLSFPLHNAAIDLMPIDTHAQPLGKRQIEPQNRQQSQLNAHCLPLQRLKLPARYGGDRRKSQESQWPANPGSTCRLPGPARPEVITNTPQLASVAVRVAHSSRALRKFSWRGSRSHHPPCKMCFFFSFSYCLHGS